MNRKKEITELVYDNGYIKVYQIKIVHYSYNPNKFEYKSKMSIKEAKELDIDYGAKVLYRDYKIKFDDQLYPEYAKIFEIKKITPSLCDIYTSMGIIRINRCEAYDQENFHYYHNGISNKELERIELQAHLKTDVYMNDKGYQNLNKELYNEKYNEYFSAFKLTLLSNYEDKINSQKVNVKSK